jgi:hypothetical protein
MNKKILFPTLILCFAVIDGKSQIPCSNGVPEETLLKILAHKPVGVDPNWFYNNCNVTDSVKRRLIYLLNPEWSNEEINYYLDADINKSRNWYEVDERAKSVSLGNDSLFKVSVDSIINYIKSRELKYLESVNFYGVDGSILKAVAMAQIKEAIPIFKKIISDKHRSFNMSIVELALARLGDRASQENIFSECLPENNSDPEARPFELDGKIRKLFFVRTQESIYQISHWLDTVHTYQQYEGGPIGKNGCRVIDYLYSVISLPSQYDKNFRRQIESISYSKEANSVILKFKKWFVANKGKYVFLK